VAHLVELFVQRHDFDLCLEVNLVVMRCVDAVARALAVLRHHDDRRLQRCDHRQNEVEEDERVRVEAPMPEQPRVADGPDNQEENEGDDEAPRAADARDSIGDAVAEVLLLRHIHVDVARNGLPIDGALKGARFLHAERFRPAP
jgi:hypothetical protein